MTKEFIEVMRMRFSGVRYSEHKLDVSAMRELINLQEILYQSIEILNEREYATEQKLTSVDKEKYAIYLAELAPGSTIATLQVAEDNGGNVFNHVPAHEEAKNCTNDLVSVISAAEEDRSFPKNAHRRLFKNIEKIGRSLPTDCKLEVCTPDQSWVLLTSKSKQRFEKVLSSPYTDTVTFQGVVLEANVKTKEFTLWINDREEIKVEFKPDQEEQITTALKEHNQIQLRLNGEGRFRPDGSLEKVHNLTELGLINIKEDNYDTKAEPIWEAIAKITESLPNDFWDNVPSDLSENHDAYLVDVYAGNDGEIK
ncbi:MAG: hypothetical protein OXC80_08150 [Gammaproteobacteria bacterium]|nr:hypothetical protein [Gammaproteobacteria bacterium]